MGNAYNCAAPPEYGDLAKFQVQTGPIFRPRGHWFPDRARGKNAFPKRQHLTQHRAAARSARPYDPSPTGPRHGAGIWYPPTGRRDGMCFEGHIRARLAFVLYARFVSFVVRRRRQWCTQRGDNRRLVAVKTAFPRTSRFACKIGPCFHFVTVELAIRGPGRVIQCNIKAVATPPFRQSDRHHHERAPRPRGWQDHNAPPHMRGRLTPGVSKNCQAKTQ